MKRGSYYWLIAACVLALSAAVSGCGAEDEQGQETGETAAAAVTGYIDLGTARIYYEDSGSGRPVVMLHGGLLDAAMWDGQFEEFAKRYRVIRYDARGHGRSVCMPDTFSHHEDLRAVIEKLGLEKPVIVGLSMGGYTAIDFALEYPDLPAALVLVSPGLTGFEFKSPEFMEFSKRIGAAVRSDDTEEIIEAFQAAWTDGPRRTPEGIDPAIRRKVREMILKNVQGWEERSIEYRPRPLAIERLDSLRVPVLALAGDLDMPGILEIVELIESNVAGSQTVLVSGSAHLINMEKPEEFNRIVLEFLDALPHASGE